MKNTRLLALLTLFIACKKAKDAPQNLRFAALSAAQTGVNFDNKLTETADWNIIQYLYFYNGGGVATGDVNGDGLPDLYFTSNQGSNKLYINKGNFQFEDATQKAGVADSAVGNWKTGVTMADVNGDGRLDIYVCHVSDYKNRTGKNRLFINNGDGTFTDKAAEFGLDIAGLCTQAAFFDSDGDGDLDVYIMRHSVHSPRSYRPVQFRNEKDDLSSDLLLRNYGGKFADVSAESGIHDGSLGYGLGLSVGDVNGDGAPDIYVGNDFHDNDYLYLNDGTGKYTEGSNAAFGHNSNFSMGNDLADFNNDGRLDIVGLDMKPEEETILKASGGSDAYNIFDFKTREYGFNFQFSRNALQLNRGNLFQNGKNTVERSEIPTTGGKGSKSLKSTPSFSEIAQFSGIAATDWSWSALFADLDNDGWKDLFITNGIVRRPNDLDYIKYTSNDDVQRHATDSEMSAQMPDGKAANYAFRNKSDLTFENTSESWGLNQYGLSNGAAYADLDGDGDLDLVVNNLNSTALILKNQSENFAKNNFFNIKLVGRGGNTEGVGARVVVYTRANAQMQELQPTRGFQSSVEPILHFGIRESAAVEINNVDSVRVIWRDGATQILQNLQANQTLTLRQTEAKQKWNFQTAIIKPQTGSAAQSIVFQDITSRLDLKYKHKQDAISDFDNEKLLPHALSTDAPKLAVGDVDGDGLADVFVGGNSGKLFFQTKSGNYTEGSLTVPNVAAAAFFDADGDGDLDLYVTCRVDAKEPLPYDEKIVPLMDRLFLNDGKGKFKMQGELPPHNGSCVRAADFDGDGDLDLFVGSRSDLKEYGLSPKSFLLQNDGKGNFKNVTPQYCPLLDSIGMVTDAVWTDMNGDGKPDLVVVGEWMPITILMNRGDDFEPIEIENTSGWWKTVAAADLNGDGKPDLVVGNMGLNSNWQASPAEPMGLYVKDFDGNGDLEPIISYWRQGIEWVYASKDELTAQMPSLRKRFPDYAPFAKSPFDKVFPKEIRNGAVEKHIQQFASVVLMNKGGGELELKKLPSEVQFSTVEAILIEDFDGDGAADIAIGGNFYEMQPSIGRFDASFGSILKGDGVGNFTPQNALETNFILRGAVRDIKRVGNMIFVAANGQPLQVFELKKREKKRE